MNETEWFQGRGVDEHELAYWGRILTELAIAVAIGICAAWTTHAYAEPRLAATNGGVTIKLYDDPCELKEHVSNLQFKATWQEGGHIFQGCWAPRPDMQLVAAYFDDLTVAIIPFGVLKRVQGA